MGSGNYGPRLFDQFDKKTVEKWYVATPKWALAEALMHMAAKSTDGYDDALSSGEWFKVASQETERAIQDRRDHS